MTIESMMKKYPGLKELVKLSVLEAMEQWGSAHTKACYEQKLAPMRSDINSQGRLVYIGMGILMAVNVGILLLVKFWR